MTRPPDLATAGAIRSHLQAAIAGLRTAAPGTGACVNECDYFQPDWHQAFWGPNYPRLARVKQRYNPEGPFTVHHGVGSESRSADRFTRATMP